MPRAERLGAAVRTVSILALSMIVAAAAQADERAADPAQAGADVSGASLLASSLTPGVGQGDFEFYVDVAGIRRASQGHTITRVLVQLPARRILDQTDEDHADLRVRVLVYDGDEAVRWLRESAQVAAHDEVTPREGAERADQDMRDMLADFGGVQPTLERETRVEVRAQDRAEVAETDYRLAELALELPPGDHVVEVHIENLSRYKRGLLDRLRRRHLASTARVLVRIPDLDPAFALADPVFRIGHGARQDYASRVYGLMNDSLHVSTMLYGTGALDLEISARDRAGEVHWRDSLSVDVSSSRTLEFSTSVNALPAGQYTLTLRASSPEGSLARHRSFDVAWSLSSWHKSRRDLDLEAEIVLTGGEFQTYSSLPLGEKERFMDVFWTRQDPTPESAYNEVLQEFHRRVAYADITYSEGKRGALTDRGKVYVRFGAPQEVQAEAVSGHLAGQGTEGLIEKVEDPFSTADEVIHGFPGGDPFTGSGEASAAERTRLNQEHNRVIGPARELMAYELWVYAGNGTPLLERDVLGIDTGFRILFADTQGFGEYRVRKTSVTLDIPGLRPSF